MKTYDEVLCSLALAKKKYQLFKPSVDNRYSDTEVVSHSGDRLECQVLQTAPPLAGNAQQELGIGVEHVAEQDKAPDGPGPTHGCRGKWGWPGSNWGLPGNS